MSIDGMRGAAVAGAIAELWPHLTPLDRLSVVSGVLADIVTVEDTAGWRVHAERGGPVGVNPCLVAFVRELQTVTVMARAAFVAMEAHVASAASDMIEQAEQAANGSGS